MKSPALAVLALSTLVTIAACSKTKEDNQVSGNYIGVAIQLRPVAPPNDSVSTTITLKLANGRFSGSSDTTRSQLSGVIGNGAYVIQSGKIIFAQDSLTFSDLGPNRELLTGTYDLIKTSDSLVFQRVPEAGLLGAGSNYFRLRAE